MKKLLAIFSFFAVTMSSTFAVISCAKKENPKPSGSDSHGFNPYVFNPKGFSPEDGARKENVWYKISKN